MTISQIWYIENMLIANLFFFILGLCIIWVASGLIVRGVERFSKSTKISSFATSFLILGFLTSLTEISVGLNAVLDKKPSIFVGNLIGGSFVILMLIVPMLAIWNGGIAFRRKLDLKKLLFFLVLIAAPSFVTLDGQVSISDAWLLLILYLLFINLFQREQRILDKLEQSSKKNRLSRDLLAIVIGAILIYIAGKILVEQTISLSEALGVPSLLISLLVLSIGTNLPELTIAARAMKNRHSEIAFGDYIGSAATNVALFAILTFIHGSFQLETRGFTPIFFIIILGYVLFFIFSRHKNRLAPAEGAVLIVVYLMFVLFQITEILSLAQL